MNIDTHIKKTEQKALEINLNPRIYGTFAEIGAGQEVARNFFQVGALAGTIAKTMSAYDKIYSRQIEEIEGYNADLLHIYPYRVYEMIQEGSDQWKSMVPEKLVEVIQD
jgi:hypothetical protein